MDDVIIQPASAADAPALAALHGESFGAAAWSREQIEGSLNLDTTRGWAAYKDNEPAGFILCQIMPDQAEILTFCVSPARRGRQIGERLLRQAIAASRENRTGTIFLEVAADNHAACNLYRKLGFHVSGRRPDYYRRGAETIDAVMYQLSIPTA